MKWFSAWIVMAVGLFLASGAMAEGRIQVEVMVSQISDVEGSIDARGQKLHSKLKSQFRYESLKVIDNRRFALAVDEVGSLRLPNGKNVRVRPLQVDPDSALLAVEVEGAVKTDVRVRNGHLVVIGASSHGDGKLIVSLEPRW